MIIDCGLRRTAVHLKTWGGLVSIMYAVYSGTEQESTADPAKALSLARAFGPDAFVTERNPGHGPSRVVWTPETDRRCVGSLIEAVITDALAGVQA
jgi:hypothetical protein